MLVIYGGMDICLELVNIIPNKELLPFIMRRVAEVADIWMLRQLIPSFLLLKLVPS